jgi:acyl carrier protein
MIQKLSKIFENTLSLKKQASYDNISSDTLKQWDSLNHLKLIMAIEQEFNVQFETEVIPQLNSFKKICSALMTLGKS